MVCVCALTFLTLCCAGPHDIVDGNEKLTLAIVNELVQHFQINFGSSKDTVVNRRSSLLTWFSTILPDFQPTNLTTCWRDGRILTALVNYYKPGALPEPGSLDPDNGLENITNAMNAAESELNVYQVLDPEDFVAEKPEEFMMMTYLSSFCSPGSIGQLHLLRWVKSFLPKAKIDNLSSNWSDGSVLCALVNVLAPGSTPLPVDPLPGRPPIEAIQAAMEVAKKELDIEPKYMAEEIWHSKQNDQIKLMVYLAQLQSLGIEPLFDPLAFSAGGTGIEGTEVNSDATITVRGRNSSVEDLTIVITSPDGSLVDFDVVPSSNNTSPNYHYKPNTAGIYTVDISVHGEPIKGSPYHVMHSNPILSKRCFVPVGKVIKGKLNTPIEFTVDCSEGGVGRLAAVVENPVNEQVQNVTVTPKSNGQYQVKFTPDVTGSHNAYISWNGNPVKNSPYVCRISDPDSCIAKGPGLSNTILGCPATFEVDTFHSGPGNIAAEVFGPANQVKVKLISEDGGVYSYQYTPQQMGAHHIEIKWDGFQIVGSPFTVHPKEHTIASSCFVKELPLERSVVNTPISVIVDATKSSVAELNAIAQGPSKEEECDILCVEEGIHSVTFYPKEVGEYSLEIYYGGSSIPDSPLHFTVNDPSKCRVNLDKKKRFSIDKAVSFQVSTFDAGEGDLLAIASSANEEFLCNVLEGSNGKYLVSFAPRESGNHDITLRFDGKTFLDSPLSIDVSGESLSDVVISKPALPNTRYYLVNQQIEINMHAPGRDPDAFEVSGIGTDMGAQPSVLVLEPVGDHDYIIKFKAAYADDYKVNIKYKGNDLPQSPLILSVRQPPCAEKVLSFDPVIPLSIGKPIELVFDTSQAGEGHMENLTAEITAEPDIRVMYSVEEVSPNLYRMVFMPRKDGAYTVNVMWFGTAINGSPYKIEFKEQVRKPAVVIHFEPELDSRSILTALAVGQNTAAEPKVKVQQFERGKYQISFSPDEKDIYMLHVKVFGQEIKGSPFIIDLLSPSQQELPQVKHIENVTLDLVTSGSGVLSAYVVGRESGSIPVKINLLEDKSKAVLSFEDKKKDVYTLYVYWNHHLVRGAPFELDLSVC